MSMIRPTTLLLALGTLSLVLLGLTSCGGNSGDVGESAGQFSRLSLVVTTDQSLRRRSLLVARPPQLQQVPGDPDFVSRLEVSIQAPDMEPITQSFLVTAEQQTAVTVQLRVSKGANREIIVSAFNAEDIKIFENATIVPLIQDTESVTIELKRVLARIEVTPPMPAIADGTTQPFTATGLLADGTTQDLTTLPEVTWVSSETTVASISNVDGSRGLATALAAGLTTITASFTEDTTTITASSAAISGSATLTVTEAVVDTITVTPADPTIADGTTQQFTATATLTDRTLQDFTTQVTWESSDESVAVVSNAAGSQGLATALAPGPATITASFMTVQGTTTLEVLETADVIPVDSSGPFCIRDSSSGNLIVTVQNQGAGPAGPFRTTVDFGNFGNVSLSTSSALAPNESVDLSFPIPPDCFDPDCSFNITVDDLNEAPETDETNNTVGDTCLG